MSLTKNTKLKELQRKRQEDEQYLKDMVNSFPFGRGGGGAPIRDKNGNITIQYFPGENKIASKWDTTKNNFYKNSTLNAIYYYYLWQIIQNRM